MKIDADEVTRVLAEWVIRQRWYAGKSRQAELGARALATLATDPSLVQIWVVDAVFDTGVEHYQVPLVLRYDAVSALDHAYLGSVIDQDEQRPVQIYDALHDKEVTGVWLQGFAREATVDGVRFQREVEPELIPLGQPSLVLTAEQSNTSLVYGDSAIMKVFRRLEPGINPDIEIHAALGRLGDRHVARLLGHAGVQLQGEHWSLAMMQEFLKTATDGWQLATASVRDLMAEGDLHAEEAGGDFAAESNRLGASTAEVHADLATAFRSEMIGPDTLAARAAAMNLRLDRALLEVRELAEVEDGLRQAYSDFAAFDGPVRMQRVHGDLHLGQVLRTVQRWVVLDFEGEPAKAIADRQSLDSPLRDVAGMLRSFDYAARHQLIEVGATSQSEFRAQEWADRNRAAFCEGYAAAGGLDPADSEIVLRAFEADKAVYEAVYEARNRPHWLPIPLASLHRLAKIA
jgi:maltokinase